MLATPDNRSGRFLLALITLVGLALRLAYFEQPSLWWDEFITVGASLRQLPDMLTVLKYLGPSDIQAEFFPPLHHLLLHGLAALAHSDALMRLPSVVAGTAMIPAVFLLCRKPLGLRPALMAALLTALSVYQMHYSREVRPYALFMLENLLALHALYAAVAEGRRRMLWLYGLCVAAMLYTSYMAAMLICGHVLFAGLTLGGRWLWLRQCRRAIFTDGLRLALTLAAAAALYLPWARGQLNVLALLRDPGFTPKLDIDFLAGSLREFAAYAYQGDMPTGWILLGLGLAGAFAAVRRGKGRFVMLLAIFCLMPLAGILLAKARMELTSRYIFPLSITLLLFSANFLSEVLDWLADRLFRGSPPIPAARLIAGLALCLYLNTPNSQSLDGYYRRETSHFKEMMASLAELTANQDMVLFYSPRNLKVAFDWYARGLLAEARDVAGGGYHRAMLLAQKDIDATGHLPDAVFRTRLYGVDVLGVGLPRRLYLPMTPGPDGRFVYHEEFKDFRMLEDVREAHNLVPSLVNKALVAYDSGLPGHAQWRFAALRGRRVLRVSLDLEISLFATADIPSDASIRVSLIPEDGGEGREMSLSFADFIQPDGTLEEPNHEKKRKLTRHLELDVLKDGQVPSRIAATTPENRPANAAEASAKAGAGTSARADTSVEPQEKPGMTAFTLRLDFGAATKASPMQVESFRVSAQLDGPPATPEEKPLADLESFAAGIPLAPWHDGEDLVASRALHAFSLHPATSAGPSPDLAGNSPLPLGSPEDLAAYSTMYPGQKPVKILNFADGRPAIALYDPALADPWLAMPAGTSRLLDAVPATRRTFAGLGLRGGLNNPTLTLGAAALNLPVTCPAPAVLAINPGEQAQLRFTPLFTQDGLDMAAMAQSANIRRNDGEDCLSCADDGPCSLTYEVSSGLPITGFRLEAFPRLFCDPARSNTVSTSYSVNGRDFLPLDVYESTGSGRWEGWKVPRRSLVHLKTPARILLIRFALSGPKTQLWSSPDARMTLEVHMDATGLPKPVVAAWPVRMSLANPTPVEVLLLESPNHIPDALKRNH